MRALPLLPAFLLLLALPHAQAAPRKVDFNRDVRPILSDNCFACHGFDAKKREAELRLDLPEGAYAIHDGVQAFKPGDPAQSEALRRILAQDPDEVMPPPKSHKKLTPAQVDTLRRWIDEGAVYQRHWSFEPLLKPTAPAAPASVSPVDSFLRAELKAHGLLPAPEASREQLIRRVTLDLTGLPPTPAEVDAFLADGAPGAYERVVDRLLGSPRYGEHMARPWLDAARYADTHGLHLDNERSMWPYRDWVVKALNDNLSFDQFTTWQLAGDLLPNATRDQRIASGFNRCNVTTGEGGSIAEEWLFRYAVDRTETTMGVWMGLTAGCAVCHDHKFDPFTAKDFYSMYAFFNSAADPAMDGNILLTPPVLQLATPEQEKQVAALDSQISTKKSAIREALAKIEYIDPATLNPPPPVQTGETVWFEDAFPAGAKVESSGLPTAPTALVSGPEAQVHSGKASLRRQAKGVSQDFFTKGASFAIPPNGVISVWCHLDPADQPKAVMLQFHVGGWNHRAVWGEEGAIPFGRVRTPEKVSMGKLPEPGKWVQLRVPADKLGLKPGMKVDGYAFTQFDGTVHWDRLSIEHRVEPAKDVQWSWKVWSEKKQGTRVEELPPDLQTLVRGKKAAEWSPAEVTRLKDWWLENEYQGAREVVEGVRAERLALEATKKTLSEQIPSTLVMADLPQPRQAFLMTRGQYDKPGEKVSRATPAVFPPLRTQGEPTRLDLARWLLAPENPLTARVTVNRLWQQFFGTGLVKSANDFGTQGDPPSHPELLDWLAATFRESGWDTKALVRLLVTTAAYRQSAELSPELLAKDPENRLLARGPRFRLDAEVIRDNALFVSGLLNPQIGGKAVRTYQPDNIWEPVGFSGSNTARYTRDKGDSLYRRSLYTFWKRTAPPPSMATFDAPARESSCLRRDRSNTPLQALVLLNDIQHVEAARAFAQRILKEGGTTAEERVRFAWRTVLARRPTAEENAIVQEVLQKHAARYAAAPAAAAGLVAFGESKPDPTLKPEDLAPWTLVANLVLNLDETLNK